MIDIDFLNTARQQKRMIIYQSTERVDVVKCLVDMGMYGWPSSRLSPQVLSMMMTKGIDVHEPLLNAVGFQDEALVRFLVTTGADVHTHGEWPLCIAIRNKHERIIRFLIASGANVEADDCYPLRLAGCESLLMQ